MAKLTYQIATRLAQELDTLRDMLTRVQTAATRAQALVDSTDETRVLFTATQLNALEAMKGRAEIALDALQHRVVGAVEATP